MAWDALTIGKVIYDTCKNLSGLSLRVYPLRIPQGVDLSTYPAVTYQIQANQPEYVKDSRSLVDTVRFQISIFASTYTLTTGISALIREAMDGLSGETAGCSVDYIVVEDETDGFDDEQKIFIHDIDFSARIKNDSSQNINYSPVIALNVSDDYTWTNAIPAGFMVEYLAIEESTGNTGQISFGTTLEGTNIAQSEAVTGGGLTIIDRINQRAISLHNPTTIYINHAGVDDNWNGINITVYCIMRKIN